MAKRKIRYQSPFAGGRDALPSCVLPSILARVQQDARQYGVSRSFVIATILAHHYGIVDQEDYTVPPSSDRRPLRNRRA